MIERFHFKEISSTNDYAKELIKDKSLIAVSADFQLSGRGRNSKVWEGEAFKNIYLSFAINHKNHKPYQFPSRYQALGALLVFNVLSKYISENNIRIKYPNDIYLMDNGFKKVSGILIEHSIHGKNAEYSIIGIGINISQNKFSDEIRNNTTSLNNLGFEVNLNTIYDQLILEFEKLIFKSELEIFIDWREKLNIINKNVFQIGRNRYAYIKHINDDCSLLAFDENNFEIRVDNGDSIRYEL